jgi:hypothetical protein
LPLEAQTVSQMVDHVLALPEGSRLMILAPVVANRKGEQLDLFAELRAQGFARLRVDGQIHEIDALPKLAKTHKHTIDVVVDRLKVREDIRQRLAESFETALRHADGRAIAYEMDSEREHLFSAKFACPVCSYSIRELEPRIFSFNSPMGACQKCDGLGVIQFFDPKRIVARPDLSLAAGAIRGWDRRNPFYFQMLCSLAAHYGFEVDTPFGELPDNVRQVILYGSGREQLPFSYLNERGRSTVREHAFEGVVVNLERRYKETDSLAVREELARLISNQTCPACQGSRLREEARNVRVGSKDSARTLHEISRQPLTVARDYFLSLQLPGNKAQVAEKVLKEIVQPPAVPDQCRPRLPVARPFGGNAVRRRGATHPAGLADRLGADRRDVRPRRTVDRPASARQRAAAEDAEAIARHRQYRDRRRARRGSDPQRRLRRRHRPRRRRPRRPGHRRRGTPAAIIGNPASLTGDYLRPPPHRHARQAAPARSASDAADRRRARQQPQGRHGRHPGRPVHLRHRRFRARASRR